MMQRDDVIRLAQEAGMLKIKDDTQGRGFGVIWWSVQQDEIERFARLVQQATAEECAEIAESGFKYAYDAYQVADAIRANAGLHNYEAE